jgi:hypothetical protein
MKNSNYVEKRGRNATNNEVSFTIQQVAKVIHNKVFRFSVNSIKLQAGLAFP